MPKTRRKKINAKRSLRTSPNVALVKAGGDQINPVRGDVIFVQKLTGINKGRTYPYASKKRGGRPIPSDLRLQPRQIVAVSDGA